MSPLRSLSRQTTRPFLSRWIPVPGGDLYRLRVLSCLAPSSPSLAIIRLGRNVIEVRNLSYVYEPDRHDRPALSNINLDLRPGEWVSILGTNGSGKSTLLKCIIGLLQPSAGSVAIDSVAISDPSPVQQSRIGLVFQNPDDQIVSPVVESEIAFGLENLGVPHDDMINRVDEILDRFDLTRYRRSDPHLLSGGERQQLAIASVVVTRPDFLLFDEPFSMLDPASRDDLVKLIGTLKSDGLTPIVVGQDPDEALNADRLLICHEGAIVEDAAPSGLLAQPDVLQRYGLTTTTTGRLARALGMPPPIPLTEVELLRTWDPQSQGSVEPLPDRQLSETVVLEARDLYFSYDSGLPTEQPALLGVNLTIRQGESVALIGPSGSGKSTLALHVNGLHTPTSGSLHVCGIDVADRKSHDSLRRKVGLVFQFPESQLFAETIAEDVGYGPRNHGMDNIDDRVDTALRSVGLFPGEFRDRNPFSLSDGEKRRAALAGVLATSPTILVLDEPTAGLDPSGADELDAILHDLRDSGVTLILVTHDLDRAASLSDRIIGILGGKVVVDERPESVFSDDAYLDRLELTSPIGIRLVRHLRESGSTLPESILTSDQLVATFAQS